MTQINRKYIAGIWGHLTGDPKEFSMESRAFNAVSIISLLLLAILFPFNYFIGLYKIAILITVIFVAQCFFYYLSRVKKRFAASIPLYAIASYTLIIINFYLNSGSYGPTLMLFILDYILLIALTPKKQFKIWMAMHIVSVLALLLIEYLRPATVPYTYHNIGDRLIDMASSYVIIIVSIHLLMTFIRKNYDDEKRQAEKNADAVQLQNLELEKLNDEKNKLFSIISHDLRSPLASIQSYMEVLSANLLTEQEKADVERQLLQLTNSTSELLVNLLSWSRAQMQGVSVNLAPYKLSAIVAEALSVQYTLSAKKNIQITTSVSPELVLIADKDMLQLVIRNLVSNAIKFSPSDSHISVSGYLQDGQIEVIIKDNGIGIIAEMHDEIFTARSRSTPGTRDEKGVGLGLLLCKEFTEMQHGKIWFESIPGHGSTFHLSFPSATTLP